MELIAPRKGTETGGTGGSAAKNLIGINSTPKGNGKLCHVVFLKHRKGIVWQIKVDTNSALNFCVVENATVLSNGKSFFEIILGKCGSVRVTYISAYVSHFLADPVSNLFQSRLTYCPHIRTDHRIGSSCLGLFRN